MWSRPSLVRVPQGISGGQDTINRVSSLFPDPPHPGGIHCHTVVHVSGTHVSTHTYSLGVRPDKTATQDCTHKVTREWGENSFLDSDSHSSVVDTHCDYG